MKKSRYWELIRSVASTLVFVWFFTNHIAQATVVPTESMMPTILVGDHFVLDKFAFPANYPTALQQILPERVIERGDILAFWSPEDPELRLVKRAIGLPGDLLEWRDGKVYVNEVLLDEPYTIHILPRERRGNDRAGPILIPPDHFFMMGDNRDNSRDSRYWGLVHRKNLIGKPLFIYWSYDSGPYRERTLDEWANYYGSMALNFFTKTRWFRTGLVLE